MDTLLNLSNRFFYHLSSNLDNSNPKHRELHCLHSSLRTFLRTGAKEDAFIVYFCFCEIQRLFGEGYDNTKKLLDLLSDHEYHSGELLAKHRDHYSHSVYVFALGLAIFANNKSYRQTYCEFYDYSDYDSYSEFLYYWGITSLFHDIGYPFQLAHEQIKQYCCELWGNSQANPYVTYGNFDDFISIKDNEREIIASYDNNALSNVKNINKILAYAVNLRLGYNKKEIEEKLYSRVLAQPNFMDHGYFSSVLILKQLLSSNGLHLNEAIMDVLSAILLHNNFNKYDIPNSRSISLNEHPLAYLMILCDELQNWDRYAYGKISKRDPIAYDIRLNIDDNAIRVNYIFDKSTVSIGNTIRSNKSFEEIQSGTFTTQIIGGKIGNKNYKGFISPNIGIAAYAEEKAKIKKHSFSFSDSNLVNLYDFAVAIHASYLNLCNESSHSLNMLFGELPLEFKISNIELAKSYSHKLELINCFYSDKDLDYPIIDDIEEEQYGSVHSNNLEILSRNEHVRWVREKIKLGWKYGESGVDFTSIKERNHKKLHNCIIPYELLSEEDKNKDRHAIKNIIPMLRMMGSNIKVYRLPYEQKPTIIVAGIGHRYIKDDTSIIKKKVKEILTDLCLKYNVIVSTSYAYGADQIIAECANELNLMTQAVLPYPYDVFIKYVKDDAFINGIKYNSEDEMHLRLLLAQTMHCESVKKEQGDVFEMAAIHNINRCNKLIAIWDGQELPLNDENKNPINRGGTYDCIVRAKELGLKEDTDIFVIKCNR
ncbi:MAG: hypothetical protein J6Q61_07115 [Bacteroidales bacterium]|nr:hypothetical protein [Bacteroidales bacterium]